MNLIINEPICGICGEPHHFRDCSFIHITNYVPDNVVPSRAKLTLPDNLRIEKMTEGSYSVIATNTIEKGTQYGPFEANKTFTLDPEIIFPLKIFTTGDYFSEYYLETNNETVCNWMMYILPALNIEEQNLICYQEHDKIYYISVCNIQAGEYLKVWYAPYYAKRMNKYMLTPLENTDVDFIGLLYIFCPNKCRGNWHFYDMEKIFPLGYITYNLYYLYVYSKEKTSDFYILSIFDVTLTVVLHIQVKKRDRDA